MNITTVIIKAQFSSMSSSVSLSSARVTFIMNKPMIKPIFLFFVKTFDAPVTLIPRHLECPLSSHELLSSDHYEKHFVIL